MTMVPVALVLSLCAVGVALFAAARAERATRIAEREKARGRLRALAAAALEVQLAADAYVTAIATQASQGPSEAQRRKVFAAAADYRRACRSLESRSAAGFPTGGQPWLRLLIDERGPEVVAETRAGEGLVSVLSRVGDAIDGQPDGRTGSLAWRWLALTRLARIGTRGLLYPPSST